MINIKPPGNRRDAHREMPDVPMQWRRMLTYLLPYKGRLSLAILGLVISAALSLVFPAVIRSVVDTVLAEKDLDALNTITLALLGVFLLRSLSSLVEVYNLNYVGERIVVDLRKQLFRHMQMLSLQFFAERRIGELLSRLGSDVHVMRTALTSNLNTLLQQSLVMLGSVGVMIVINYRLTLFILVLTPVLVFLGFFFGIYLRRLSTEIADELAAASIVAQEVLQNIREVKSFVREEYEIDRYNGAIHRALRAAIKLLRLRSIFSPLVGFLGFGALAVILWFGGREVIEGRLSGGELIAFLIYGLTVATSFGSLVSLYTSFQEAIGSTKRVFQILDTVPHVRDARNAIELTQIEGRITFDHVSFTYDTRQPVLEDVSLDIAPGEIIALVGPSGAGKSTMFNLIPRFYDVTGGSLRVDGTDVRQISQASLRQQIGVVPQETLLFGGTIRENMLYGRLDATEDEMIAASRAANAHDFIMEMPDGYETIVGERGIRLSGGQRQRVAIARAILKDPRILLLDEATSSLDNESEYLVQEALGRLMRNRTTVIIAHRLSTIRIAHRVAVLNRGQVVELGTHDELMALNGLYAKLYEMQFHEQELLAQNGATSPLPLDVEPEPEPIEPQ